MIKKMEETINLGESIELTGSKELDNGVVVILKKMIGNYVKRIGDHETGFEKFNVTIKKIHETEKNSKFQINGKMIVSGKVYSAEITDFNLFFALNSIFNKIEKEIK